MTKTLKLLKNILGIWGLLVIASNCRHSDEAIRWEVGHRYALRLYITKRASLTLRSLNTFIPLRDTISVSLQLDSVAHDSLYGIYLGNFDHSGIRVGDGRTQVFAGVAVGDTLRLQLAPNVGDAGLVLSGTQRNNEISGTWYSEAAGRARGRFQLEFDP